MTCKVDVCWHDPAQRARRAESHCLIPMLALDVGRVHGKRGPIFRPPRHDRCNVLCCTCATPDRDIVHERNELDAVRDGRDAPHVLLERRGGRASAVDFAVKQRDGDERRRERSGGCLGCRGGKLGSGVCARKCPSCIARGVADVCAN